MSCDGVLDFLDVTIGDAIDPSEVGVPATAADEARAHVAVCAACAARRAEIGPGPHFIDVTAESGIGDLSDHTGVEGSKDWMVETVGHGAAVFDYNGDGRLDLFVPDGNRIDPAQHVRHAWRLYHNDG